MSRRTVLFVASLFALGGLGRVASAQCTGNCPSQGQATLTACPTVRVGTPMTVSLEGRLPAQPALLMLSLQGGPICAPFGKLCVVPEIFISPCVLSQNKKCDIALPLPDLLPGSNLFFQGLVLDNTAPNGQFALSNGQKITVQATPGPIGKAAYPFLAEHAARGNSSFFIYRDDDDGLNHAKASCWWGATSVMSIACSCVDSSTSTTGCATNPRAVDQKRGTVMGITWKWTQSPQFAGISFVEATAACPDAATNGYNVLGARDLVFDARATTNMSVNISVGSGKPIATALTTSWKTITIPLSRYSLPRAELQDLKVLFVIGTDTTLAPSGGTVLLDDIRYTPSPIAQRTEPSLPASYVPYGVTRQGTSNSCAAPIPNDLVLRNLATVADASMTLRSLLWEPKQPNLATARSIADSLVYALNNPNFGVRIPGGGLHEGYGNGDLRLRNDQGSARANQAKLAGFTTACNGPYGLIQDGASTRSNAMAVLSLVAAHRQFGGNKYLDAARKLGDWIGAQPRSTTGYAGYHAGFLDGGNPIARSEKWTVDNASVYAAFHALAKADPTNATKWTFNADHAEAFLRAMYDATKGRFNAGSVPVGTREACGVALGATMSGERMNTFDWLDAQTMSVLALTATPRTWVDLNKVLAYADTNFRGTATDNNRTYSGYQYNSVRCGCSGGVAWDLTAQMASAMQAVDVLNRDCAYGARVSALFAQIQAAQSFAPFGNGAGIVEASVSNASTALPTSQCLKAPYRCVPQRVSLAATTWAIVAELEKNPLDL